MSDTLAAALIAVSGTLMVGFIASFLAEDYRRFRDGQALASALAGELLSRSEAVHMLRDNLTKIVNLLRRTGRVRLLKVEQIKDHVFESNVSKLGLLENDMVEDVVYVYENIGAFRSAMSLAADRDDDDPQKLVLIEQALGALERASNSRA